MAGRRRAGAVALAAAAALVPSTALAAPTPLPAVKRSLSTASTTGRTCHSSLYSGKGIARTFAREGADVLIAGRDEGTLSAVISLKYEATERVNFFLDATRRYTFAGFGDPWQLLNTVTAYASMQFTETFLGTLRLVYERTDSALNLKRTYYGASAGEETTDPGQAYVGFEPSRRARPSYWGRLPWA